MKSSATSGQAALYLNPEAFDTSLPALMGRQSAGESFLRGYLRHSTAHHHYFWNVANELPHKLEGFVNAVSEIGRPSTVVARNDRRGLAAAGMVHLPSPSLAKEAWHRRMAGLTHAYGVTAITHTTASMDIMDYLADLFTAPIQPWDTLICTSRAVRASVEVELEAVRYDLEHRLGATKLPTPRLATIPLGLNTDDFEVTEADRRRWRTELNIPDEAVVVLYVGRFNPFAKMNPLPMALALERAAQQSSRPIVWVQAGWGLGDEPEKAYHDQCRALCPSVAYHVVDGRKPDVRFSIWSVGDIFISLSDNIQETFGLTPVEAMAAGIPVVVSDWDGYRDTVRHGLDGFRVSTYGPRAGTGQDLAYQYSNQWITYGAYAGAASQVTAVDIGEAAHSLAQLVDNPDLRRRMGAAARKRIREQFDWSAIIPQYEALWADNNARRLAAERMPEDAGPRNLAPNPRRLEPFHLFGGYPSEWLTVSSVVMLTPGWNDEAFAALRASTLALFGTFIIANPAELKGIVDQLRGVRQATVADLIAKVSPSRPVHVERGILYLAKYGFVTVLPRSNAIAS